MNPADRIKNQLRAIQGGRALPGLPQGQPPPNVPIIGQRRPEDGQFQLGEIFPLKGIAFQVVFGNPGVLVLQPLAPWREFKAKMAEMGQMVPEPPAETPEETESAESVGDSPEGALLPGQGAPLAGPVVQDGQVEGCGSGEQGEKT